MRTHRSSFIVFLAAFLPCFASATEVVRLDHGVAGFVNYASPGSVLLLTAEGRADWLTDAKIERSESYTVVDKVCMPRSQNTALMGEEGGLTLAYPFLVGVGRVCYLDQQARSIRLLSDFHASLPRNPFSIVYAGSDENSVYFLMNGRPFPDGTEGYLELVSVGKNTLTVSVRELVTAVPGYSGAMLADSDAVWVTVWPGSIYKIPFSKLHPLIQSGEKAPFTQLATEEFREVEGMSLFMLGNERSFLYYNGENESYTVNRSNGGRTVVKPGCVPIAGYQDQWYMLCGGNSVETWRE